MTDAALSRIDIVVSLDRAQRDVCRVVERLLASTAGPFSLALIDDGSRDSTLDALVRGDPRVELVRSPRRLGRVAAINRVLERSSGDVVLLACDALVTPGWLDGLLRCAASDTRIASVSPLSNGAISQDEALDDDELSRIERAVAKSAVPTYPDLPTASDACILMRRTAIDAIGGLDPALEDIRHAQSDFCLRAWRAGFRNVLADDVFVAQTAGGARETRVDEGDAERLSRLHRHYPALIREYAAADPLRPLHEAIHARLADERSSRRVLHVLHDRGGGTEAHVRTLVDASSSEWQHFIVTAVGDRWHVEAQLDGGSRTFAFTREEGESWPAFVGGIVSTLRISVVHVHHLSGSRDGALEALPKLGVPYGISVHDLWLACPTVTLTGADDRYCGGVTEIDACTRCLAALPASREIDIAAWRNAHARLLAGASFLIAPSHWAADMLAHYFDETSGRIDVIAHATPDRPLPSAHSNRATPAMAVLFPADDVPTVAIVGAIGSDKGARRIERLVEHARAQRAPIRFVVIGYLDVRHDPWQSDDGLLTVHGRYERSDLPALFAHYRAKMVLFPSEGPESFSYTLSEAWRAGMPALVPPIGALAERVENSRAGWVMSDDEWRDDSRMLDRLLALLSPGFDDERRAASWRARDATEQTARAMWDATSAHYAHAVDTIDARASFAAFSNARVRDALGYRPWQPPPAPSEPVAGVVAPVTLWQRVAIGALAMRKTPMGRLLYRVVPQPLIHALKARLHG
ncbi:MAG TPA: glycosyltransferase [Casimicrobiaceae bacterium]|nr:glycosyltransferase [Casimicrobiaceae bacterium]